MSDSNTTTTTAGTAGIANQTTTTGQQQTDTVEQTTDENGSATDTVDYWKQRSRENEKRAKANADAAKRLQALEESQQTEQEKQAKRLAQLEQESQTAKREAMRFRVAALKGVPADLIDRLRGDDEDELSVDADALLALVNAPKSPAPDLSQGSRGPAAAGDMNQLIRRGLRGGQ